MVALFFNEHVARMVQPHLQSYIQTPTCCLNKNARIFCCCNVSALDRHQANNLPKQRGHLKQEVAASLQSIPVIPWNQQQTSAAPSKQANNNKFISNRLRLIFLGINRWALPYLLSINSNDSHEILTWTCPELIRYGAAGHDHMPVSPNPRFSRSSRDAWCGLSLNIRTSAFIISLYRCPKKVIQYHCCIFHSAFTPVPVVTPTPVS